MKSNIKIYSNTKYKKYFKKSIRNQYKLDDKDILCDTIPNGVIVNEYEKGYGVFDDKNKFVKSSLQCHKNHKGQIIPKVSFGNIKYVDADVVYLCNMGRMQFGHFLLEHLNRAWFLLTKFYKKGIKVVLINEKKCEKLPGYIFELLKLMGVHSEDILILDKTTRFRNVYIPWYCFDMDFFYSNKFNNIFKKIAQSVVSQACVYKKIYVSRKKLQFGRKTYNEDMIQDVFEKNGYKVIFPKTMSLQKQIFLIKNCKYLAGLAGTALHMALFMKPGGTVIQIKRNSINKDNSDVQYLINKTKSLNSIFIMGSIEKTKTKHYSNLPQIVGFTEHIKSFFVENNFKFNNNTEFNNKEYKNYLKHLNKCSNINDISFLNKFKVFLIHLIALIIPGRLRRGKLRSFLRKKFNVK